MVGTFVEIQEGVTIGDRTRVQSHTFICDMVTIGNDVFVGHGVMFINDTMPPQPEKDKWLPTIIEDGASLGSNATILPVTRRQGRRGRRRRGGHQGRARRRHRGRLPREDPALQGRLRARKSGI